MTPMTPPLCLQETTLDLILRVTIGSQDKQLSRDILKVLNQQLDHASNTGVASAIFTRINPWMRYGQYKRTQYVFHATGSLFCH